MEKGVEMNNDMVLIHIPGRRVSVSMTEKHGQHTLVNVPANLRSILKLGRGTHKAAVSCYEIEQIYCKVQIYPVKSEIPIMSSPPLLYFSEVMVSVSRSNAFVPIKLTIAGVMKITKGTHCIDWTCMRNYTVFGVVRAIRPLHTSSVPY